MMPESPRKTDIPEQLGRPERRDPPMRERLLNEVLLHVAAQLRTALGGMHIAVGRLAPPDRRGENIQRISLIFRFTAGFGTLHTQVAGLHRAVPSTALDKVFNCTVLL